MARGSWDDFRSKFGFGDGATYEDRDFKARGIIVRALNKTAAFKKAKVKAIEYDRAGIHNPCLILLIPAAVTEKAWLASNAPEAGEPDVDYDAVVAQAYDSLTRRKR